MLRYDAYGLERVGKTRYHVQYRINKRGAECYRTGDRREALEKLAELTRQRPGVYSMQSRSARLDRFGREEIPLDKTAWM